MLPAFSFRRNSKLSNVLRNFSCYNKDWGTDMIKAFCALFSFFFFYLGVTVQFSCSVVSDSLWPHEPQHAKPSCPSTTPGFYSNSCPLSWWCHPTISSSAVPLSSCLQSSPASGSFPMCQLFTSGGQRIGVSASASVFPMNIQDRFPLELTAWISLLFKGLSRVFSNTTFQKVPILQCSTFFIVQLSHAYMSTGKTIALIRWTFVGSLMSLLFNMLSQFSSVQFSHSVMSNSLRPHEWQHARPPYPSPTPITNSCPSCWWCQPAISSSVIPFSSCPQSLPASGSFSISQLFASGGQSIGVSASVSVLPMNNEHPGLISFRMDRLDLQYAV